MYCVPITAHIGVTAMHAMAYVQPRTTPQFGCRKREQKVKMPPADGAWRVRETMHTARTSIGKKNAIRIASGACWPEMEYRMDMDEAATHAGALKPSAEKTTSFVPSLPLFKPVSSSLIVPCRS
ncbi:hypothetical protein D9M70_473100 [compost metagenome]